MRIVAELAYKGTAYRGWQVQRNTSQTVQQIVQDRLQILLRHEVKVVAAGRTDAGVHAAQNFIHFDTPQILPEDALRRINFLLPADISFYGFYAVTDDFHARFDAVSRTYHYFISYQKNPLYGDLVCYYPYAQLDLDRLNEAAHIFLQHEEFAAFSKKRTQVRTTRCRLSQAEWFWSADQRLLVFCVTADRFLRGMVRGLVATSIRYARGKLSRQQLLELLHRAKANRTDFSAPAQGLILSRVCYNRPMQLLHGQASSSSRLAFIPFKS
ncbi:MAG: tRNA pseudouridine(38-40) synthase TruA [Chitinophagales bacterium]|nr:tRNA pseudouridine(38-40) synthase TruA [Chitinophagales bacterium]MDW8428060.1 tRNA pseudouridine(38-40) synthase TruA [Chitinophagales bacterium]